MEASRKSAYRGGRKCRSLGSRCPELAAPVEEEEGDPTSHSSLVAQAVPNPDPVGRQEEKRAEPELYELLRDY
jgi:hypothetical protein